MRTQHRSWRLGLDTPRLALLTVVVCAAGVAQCRAVHALYFEAMWWMVQRRSLQLHALDVKFDDGALLSRLCMAKLLHGAPHVQIYVLRELGHELSSADWELFLARLDEQRSAVQATALELGAAHPQRVPNELLLALLRDGARTKPAALTVAVLLCGACLQRAGERSSRGR